LDTPIEFELIVFRISLIWLRPRKSCIPRTTNRYLKYVYWY